LAYEKGFEKKALEQQAAILGVLQKIQVALESSSSDSGDSGASSAVLVGPIDMLNQTNQIVVKELQDQTSILKDIRSSIKDAISASGRSSGGGSDSGSETKSAKDKIMEVAGKVGDTVKNIALLAGAIVVFAGALKLVSAIISPQDLIVIVPFMLVMSLAFVAFGKIVEASKGMTPKDALSTGLLMVTIAGSIVAVAGIFMAFKAMGDLSFPDPLWVLGAGLAIFIFTLPVMLLMKAMTSGSKLGGENVAPQGLNPKTALAIGLVMVATAVAIAGVAFVFSKMLVPVTPEDAPNIIWALTAGLSIAIFGLTTAMFLKNIKQSGNMGDMLRIPVIIAGAIIATAVGLVGAAYVMKGLPQVTEDDAPNIIWSLTAGLAIAIFGVGMVLLARYVPDYKAALVGGLAMIIVAGIIFTTAWIFNYLPDTLRSPSMDFTKGAGIAIAAFGAAYALMTKFIGQMDVASLLKGALAMVVTAALIVGVAWIFTLLPQDLKFPSVEFALGGGLAVAIFGAAIAGIGALVSLVTPVGFALGALGVLIAALVIVGVAWIFSLLPESLFEQGGLIYKATDALVYFGSGMITLFEKFGNALVDVGLKFINGIGDFFVKMDKVNLLSVAGGIAAIAGSMVLLAGALVGSSVAASGANLVSSVLDFGSSLFGGGDSETDKPQGFLEYLVANSAAITLGAVGVKMIGDAMKSVTEAINPAKGALDSFMNGLIGPKKGSGLFPGVAQPAITIIDEVTLGFSSMNVQLSKIATYKKPLEQIAESMKSFAGSTTQFAQAINSIELEKMNSLGATMESLKKNLDDSLVNNFKVMADQTEKLNANTGGVIDAVGGAITKVGDKLAGGDKDAGLAKSIAAEILRAFKTQGAIVVNQNGSATFSFKNGADQFIASMTTRN
jgi:methyl-accepting chemotaxis protein